MTDTSIIKPVVQQIDIAEHKQETYTEPKKRKGRLKKGEVVKESGLKTMSKDEAFKSIEALKYKIANKYKSFCDKTVSYEDLISAANVGVAWAYRDWDANTAKFITFAHNRIERQIDLYLTEMLPRYKNNIDAKEWLRRKNNESFKQLQDRGVTKDEAFNKEHGLDGTKPFTKEHYNLYTQKTANKLFNGGTSLVINPASAFSSPDNESFDILDTVIDERTSEDSLKDIELKQEIETLDDYSKVIASMLHEGATIGEVAKSLKISKKKLLSKYGVKSLNTMEGKK